MDLKVGFRVQGLGMSGFEDDGKWHGAWAYVSYSLNSLKRDYYRRFYRGLL